MLHYNKKKTYENSDIDGHVDTGFRHKACCFLKYSVTILSNVISCSP